MSLLRKLLHSFADRWVHFPDDAGNRSSIIAAAIPASAFHDPFKFRNRRSSVACFDTNRIPKKVSGPATVCATCLAVHIYTILQKFLKISWFLSSKDRREKSHELND
uniref:(northern house mosquito) hypothetical protein n=1 Tax=Culex pipiens TaxID=7175 RepID=A0A8D8L0E3_CULPI